MGQILYTVARSESGELIRAVEAEKGGTYLCGYCKNHLVLKKSGRTGPRTKRPHFAHKALTPNCSPESAMHFEFKTLLAAEIQRCIDVRAELPISWQCTYCYSLHTGNLVKKAKKLAIEHSLGICRPDVVLFNGDDRVIVAIEVVVTHAPEDAVRDHYRSNKIALVELRLTSEDDLTDIPAKLANADHVQLCPDRTLCHQCGHFQQPVEMKIVDASCYNCNSMMQVPFIEGDYLRGSHIGPDGFSQKELAVARKHGAVIE